MRHVQLKRTVFRSLAPSVGVKAPASPRPPAPPPPTPPPLRLHDPAARPHLRPCASSAHPDPEGGSWPWAPVRHHRAHRDKEREHTCRESSSIKHGQLQGLQLVDPSPNLKSLSPSSRRRMNPAGLPFIAGRIVTLRSSPGLIVTLVEPLAGQSLDGGGGQRPVHDLALDLLIRDRELDARVRIDEVQLLEPALEDHLFIQVVPPTAGWAAGGAAPIAAIAIRKPHSPTSRAVRVLMVAPLRKLSAVA